VSSTGTRPLESAVFYLDESIHSRVLVERMTSLGAIVRHSGDAFPFGTRDDVWLAACGERGWLVLMRDKRIRYRALERG
jgi:hypothetical protein